LTKPKNQVRGEKSERKLQDSTIDKIPKEEREREMQFSEGELRDARRPEGKGTSTQQNGGLSASKTTPPHQKTGGTWRFLKKLSKKYERLKEDCISIKIGT